MNKKQQHKSEKHKPDRRISIQETMNRMAGRMDSLIATHARDNPTDNTPQDIRFWIAVDPLLADLHKRLLDARAQRKRIAAHHGAQSPMANTADTVVDSNACAVETRLIELRRNKEAKAKVLAIARKMHAEEERERTEDLQDYIDAFWKDFAIPQSAAAAQNAVSDSGVMMLLAFYVFQYNAARMNRAVSMLEKFASAALNGEPATQKIAGAG